MFLIGKLLFDFYSKPTDVGCKYQVSGFLIWISTQRLFFSACSNLLERKAGQVPHNTLELQLDESRSFCGVFKMWLWAVKVKLFPLS